MCLHKVQSIDHSFRLNYYTHIYKKDVVTQQVYNYPLPLFAIQRLHSKEIKKVT